MTVSMYLKMKIEKIFAISLDDMGENSQRFYRTIHKKTHCNN